MPARRYRFHCTDGQDAVFDRAGRLIQRRREVRGHAAIVARRLMDGCASSLDWSGWIVDVHDANGRRVSVLGFDELRQQRLAA